MGSIWEFNVKKTRVIDGYKRKLKCKCGGKRLIAEVCKDDDGEFRWVFVKCAKCGNILFGG